MHTCGYVSNNAFRLELSVRFFWPVILFQFHTAKVDVGVLLMAFLIF